jgi:palmitoyltransferase
MAQKQPCQMKSSALKMCAKPMTLMERWEEHKTSGNAEPGAQALLARFAPLWYLLTITGCFVMGAHQYLFIVYEGWSREFVFCHQVFAYVTFIEMMVNWLCLRYVTSDYTAEISEYKHLKFVVTEDAIKEKMMARGMQFGDNNKNGFADDRDGVGRKPGPVQRSAVKRHISHLFANKKKAVSMGTESKDSRRYAYWSWRPCDKCGLDRPPRVVHCPLCNKCLLKRDHHCYFSGSCVSLHNQRHFIVFSFWSCLATVYSTVHALIGFYVDVIPKTSLWDLVFPLTCCRWLLGYTELYYLMFIALLYSLIWFCPISLCFFQEHITLVTQGITTFEYEKNIQIKSARTQYENFKSVFGC